MVKKKFSDRFIQLSFFLMREYTKEAVIVPSLKHGCKFVNVLPFKRGAYFGGDATVATNRAGQK